MALHGLRRLKESCDAYLEGLKIEPDNQNIKDALKKVKDEFFKDKEFFLVPEYQKALRSVMDKDQQKILVNYFQQYEHAIEDEGLGQITIEKCLRDGQLADTLTCFALIAAFVTKKNRLW